jgi:hypothetical protein
MRKALRALMVTAMLALTVGMVTATGTGQPRSTAMPPADGDSMYCWHVSGPGSPMMCTAP